MMVLIVSFCCHIDLVSVRFPINKIVKKWHSITNPFQVRLSIACHFDMFFHALMFLYKLFYTDMGVIFGNILSNVLIYDSEYNSKRDVLRYLISSYIF